MLGKVKSWKTGDEVINTSTGEKRNPQTLIWDVMAELGFEELQREGEFWSSVGCDCPLRGQKETTRGWEMDPRKEYQSNLQNTQAGENLYFTHLEWKGLLTRGTSGKALRRHHCRSKSRVTLDQRLSGSLLKTLNRSIKELEVFPT